MSETKAHTFSIYLLKEGFDQTNALKDDHGLDPEVRAAALPEGAALYVGDNAPKPPWWRAFFGIQKDLKQTSKSAIIFLSTQNRWFALTFGHSYHKLRDTSYEYDFGKIATLNCVDPEKLKSTDTVEPGASRRRRTQIPVAADLMFFDFDRDSSIVSRLTGAIKDQYKDLFEHPTGASNFRLSSKISPDKLPKLCAKLLELFKSKEYEKIFPDIQNIWPEKDPDVVKLLDEKLILSCRLSLLISMPKM